MSIHDLIMRDSRFIWHPFTQVGMHEPIIPLIRGENEFLFDVSGKRYIDAISSWWVNLHGHAHPVIAAAISRQANTLEHSIFAGFTHEPATDFAEKLASYFSGSFAKIFFSDNGSTAVEVSLKLALQYWFNKSSSEKKPGRTKILALEDAYHGDTFGAMAVGARSIFSQPFSDLLFDVTFLPIPQKSNQEKINRILSQIPFDEYAAIIYEPLLQGAGGMIIHEQEILSDILVKCRSNGLLLIADEVLTGFGRTGKLFASEYFEFMPDIMALSKGITGGFLPLGATLVTAAIHKEFISSDHSKTFFHGHSYTANPIACAAANASFDLLNSEHTQRKIIEIQDAHKSMVEDFSKLPLAQNVRHLGTILAMEVASSSFPSKRSYTHELRNILYQKFIEAGILLRPLGNTLYILPPYCINQESLTRIYQAISDILTSLKNPRL